MYVHKYVHIYIYIYTYIHKYIYINVYVYDIDTYIYIYIYIYIWYIGNYFTCSGLCSPGYYCPKNSTSSMQTPCPAGTYGEYVNTYTCTCLCLYIYTYTSMLISVLIYVCKYMYCLLNSTSSMQTPCPAGTYGKWM
jgi:hypothetical protein